MHKMEIVGHLMQLITEQAALSTRPVEPTKALLRGTALFINLLLYGIFINTPIAFTGFFFFILAADGKILHEYLLVGVFLLALIFIVEAVAYWRIWRMFTNPKDYFDSRPQLENNVQKSLSSALLFLILGMIPILHIFLCPASVVCAAEGLVEVDENKIHPKYRLTAKRFILFSVLIFIFYSSAILFIILISGNAGALTQ